MKMNRKLLPLVVIAVVMSTTISCYEEEKLNVPVKTQSQSEDRIDQRIQSDFQDKYGVTVRYKYVDRYVEINKRVVPPKLEVVEPMLDFLTSFWVEPFINVTNGKTFFEKHVPSEIIFIGSPIFNNDGTVTLGTADAGARITLTEINYIDVHNNDWIYRQLGTIYHEFAHIVHQRYSLPPNWQEISPQGYTSAGSWYNLTVEEALQRGFVSPYGTVSFNEDFAELTAFLLFHPDFYTIYINDESGCSSIECAARNEGRAKLRKKYNAVLAHYAQYTGVDLLKVRAIIQAKL